MAALENKNHQIIYNATLSGEVYHDLEVFKSAIHEWVYPRYYLDFETIAPAIPLWVGTRPFQQIPFQYSCHIEAENRPLEHVEFLSVDGSDPRRSCALSLIRHLGKAGTIITYNSSFERKCIRDLANDLPDLTIELLNIEKRIVDLLPVVQNNYYHRDQLGSWSIKKVLPMIAPELQYSALTISDGGAAQLAWFNASKEDINSDCYKNLKNDLIQYCRLDALAMFTILKKLSKNNAL